MVTTPRPKSLSHLGLSARGGRDPHLEGLTADSRSVRSGFLFAALPGSALHGATYIATAIEAGAAAILTDALGASLAKDALDSAPVALVVAEDPREALARAAALWFGAQPATMVAVTGTNGKPRPQPFVVRFGCSWAMPPSTSAPRASKAHGRPRHPTQLLTL